MLAPYCFDYDGFAVAFEIRQCDTSSFVLFARVACPFKVFCGYVNFGIVFYFCGKCYGILSSQIINVHFNSINSSNL
jgi:hypothetical protein